MRKILPLLGALTFLGGMIALVMMPLQMPDAAKATAKNVSDSTSQSPVQQTTSQAPKTTANAAFKDFKNWKKETKRSVQTVQSKLQSLAQQHPNDYRFKLEQVRGDANFKYHQLPSKALDLLSQATTTAIGNGQNQKMLKDLKDNRKAKRNGFRKLSEHKKQWKRAVQALEENDVEELKP